MTGHNKIKMTELVSLYKSLGFTDAETYIQSGNVIFENSENTLFDHIAEKIENGLKETFGHNVHVLVRSADDLKEIISCNPFTGITNFDSSKLAVIFLHKVPSEGQIDKVRNINFPPDMFYIKGKEIYIYCPNGFGRTKLYTNFFENKMKVTGTARNWNTIIAIFEMASQHKSDLTK
jgi:uncharacterized protein (DUF1697 family)